MTGRWPADLHVNTNWNVGPDGAEPNHDVGLPYNLPLPNGTGASPHVGGLPNIAHIMQQSGYATAHFGKWHLGGLNPDWKTTPKPSEYGFDLTATYGSPIEVRCSSLPSNQVNNRPGSVGTLIFTP
jgi:arylsulfatase A-like enzyme